MDCADVDIMLHEGRLLQNEQDLRNLPRDAQVKLIISHEFAIKWNTDETPPNCSKPP